MGGKRPTRDLDNLGGGSGGNSGNGGFGSNGSGGELTGFPGHKNGYKNDGRGTWANNGEYGVRHTVEQMPDGSIVEHIGITKNGSKGRATIINADDNKKRPWET